MPLHCTGTHWNIHVFQRRPGEHPGGHAGGCTRDFYAEIPCDGWISRTVRFGAGSRRFVLAQVAGFSREGFALCAGSLCIVSTQDVGFSRDGIAQGFVPHATLARGGPRSTRYPRAEGLAQGRSRRHLYADSLYDVIALGCPTRYPLVERSCDDMSGIPEISLCELSGLRVG